MGTFSATLAVGATVGGTDTPIVGVNGWISADQGAPIPTLYECLVAEDAERAVTVCSTGPTFTPPGAHTLLCKPRFDEILIDGVPTDFRDLPAGFMVDALNVYIKQTQFLVESGSSVEVKHDGGVVATYTVTGFSNVNTPPQWPQNYKVPVFDANDVVPGRMYKTFFGPIEVTINAVLDATSINTDVVGIEGIYSTWSTQITFDVSAGCPGVIVSVRDGQGGMDLLGSFFFSYVSGETLITLPATIIYNSGAQVQLVVPYGIPPGSCSVSAFLVDSPFAEVVLGTFTVPSDCEIYSPITAEETCGTRVTIVGASFSLEEVYVIKFGETPVLATVLDENTLQVFSPDHAPGIVDLALIDVQAGTETVIGSFTFLSTTPAITSIDPAVGTLAGGTPVEINGVNFVPGCSILFDGVSATSIVFVDSTKYTCVTPSHQVGAVTVQVIAP